MSKSSTATQAIVSGIFKFISVCYVAALIVFFSQAISFYALLPFGDNYQKALSLNSGQFLDYRMYLSLGKMAWSDQRFKIYDPVVQEAWYDKTVSPGPPRERIGYISYAPWFYMAMMPVSLLPELTALLAWYGVALGVGIVSLIHLIKTAGLLKSKAQISLFLLGSIANMPSWYGLACAQSHWFHLAFLSVYFLLYLKAKDILAGLTIIVVGFKPQYAVFLSIPALAQRRWKILISAAIFGLLACAAAGAYLGWDNVINYPRIVATTASDPAIDAEAHMSRTFISIRAILTVLLPWKLSLTVSSAILLISLLFLLKIWSMAARGPQQSNYWAIALTIVIMLLCSPHSHIYDGVFLAIPAALTLPTLDLRKAAKLPSIAFRIWCLLFLAFPLFSATYVMYYHLMEPDFILFIVTEAIMAVAGYCCFKQVLKGELETSASV